MPSALPGHCFSSGGCELLHFNIEQNSVICSLLPPSSTASGDIPEPPQCEQLVDCSWSEQGGGRHPNQYDSSGQGIPVESALEATEFTVKAMESESRQVSIKRNKSNLEGGVAIEMSAQPLLELTPMPGSEYRTRLQRCRIWCWHGFV